MNKFSEIRQDAIRDDLKFMKSINYNPKKLNSDIWLKFGVNPEDEVDEIDNDKGKNFITHPKRLSSDTDNTSTFSSPRRISVSSSASNVELIDNFTYEGNKLKIKDARKKLHQNLTQTKQSESCHLDIGIGDSSSVTPRSRFPEKRLQREKGKHVRIDSEVTNKIKSNVLNNSNKKLGLSRRPPLQNSHRSGITESVFERKFKTFVEKSLHTISDIRSALDRGVNQPDGDEDMSRRIVRVKEFSNRFSRNYLYPLARQMEDLTKLSPQNANLYQKLLSAYHVTLNGLQAYHNHLPTSIGTCSSNKLKELLKHIVELCNIHDSFIKQPDDNGFSDFVSTYKLNAELTLKKIGDHFTAASTDSILKSVTTKLSLPASGSTKIIKPKNKPKKNAVESRLSMYSITASFRKDPQWKKAVESFARKKLNVKSRYKTAVYRHRPPVERDPPILALPSNCKFFGKRSTAALKRTPITTPIQDDNITTMVQIENEKGVEKEKDGCAEGDTRPNSSVPLNHEEIVVKLLRLVLDNTQRKMAEGEHQVRNDETASNDGQIADILERLRNEGNVDTLQKVLDALQNKAAMKPDELQLRIVKSQSSLEEVGVKKRKEPIITVTGEKNAKLICIKDENSVIETEDDSEMEIKNEAEKVILSKVASSKTQTDIKKKANKCTQRSSKNALIKMNRLPKSSKCLQLLPKNYAVNIIQYKLDFYKHCKMNPMYKKTTALQPWMLMGKISDKLLDQALLSVAREIEVNDIVQQIYDSELQL